jgi:hypothetical protein
MSLVPIRLAAVVVDRILGKDDGLVQPRLLHLLGQGQDISLVEGLGPLAEPQFFGHRLEKRPFRCGLGKTTAGVGVARAEEVNVDVQGFSGLGSALSTDNSRLGRRQGCGNRTGKEASTIEFAAHSSLPFVKLSEHLH